jgi:hypothetical protein
MGAPAGFTKKDARVRTKRTWLFVSSTLFMVLGFAPAALLGTTLLGGSHYVGLVVVLLGYFAASPAGWVRGAAGGGNSAESSARTRASCASAASW